MQDYQVAMNSGNVGQTPDVDTDRKSTK
jgi:hypothetical protein